MNKTQIRLANLAERKAQIEKEQKDFIEVRAKRLIEVGKRVLRKKFPADWYSKDLSFLGELHYILRYNFTLVDFTATTLEFKLSDYYRDLSNHRTIKIDASMLSCSDRDFAKMLRSRIYLRKQQEKNHAISVAERDIQNLEQEIAKKTLELTQKKNLLKPIDSELTAKFREKAIKDSKFRIN